MTRANEVLPLLLLGGGGHCRSVIDVLETIHYPIAGIIHEANTHDAVLKYPALGCDGDLKELRKQYGAALVTVGQIKSPAVRKKLFMILCSLNFILPSIVSPLAHVAQHVTVGKGSVVMHQALINTGATIGENCIINTRSLIEHDCIISNHCHISINALLAGGVSVGEGSFIGAGAIVRENVHIGNNCIIGCGVTVLNNINDGIMLR